MDEDARLIPISALQHYLFCARQCALIHVEQIWQENRHTAEGRMLHERTDRYGHERRRGVRTAMALPLASEALGLTGRADVVEFEDYAEQPVVRPIEYKRGRPKAHRADEVQLCAQALCLEEMLAVDIADGALFYGQTRRRKLVPFDDELRSLTKTVADETRRMLENGHTPPAVYQPKRCDRCSLIDVCRPQTLGRQRNVEDWIRQQLAGFA